MLAYIAERIVFWIKASRYEFFTASLAPVLVGGAVAYWEVGSFHWALWGATLVALVLLHAGANLANDYYDHLSRNDEMNVSFVRPFSGGSRLIQQGRVEPVHILGASLICLALGAIVGLYLTWLVGWPLLLLGVIGGLSGFFYTARPLALGYRGWGELFIALDFGILPVLGAYYVQVQTFTWTALFASLPVALLISAVLWINQFPDYEADRLANKWHWVVRLGRAAASRVYVGIMTLTYLLLLAAVATQILPPLSLLALLTLPLAVRGINVALQQYDHPRELIPANVSTIGVHLTFAVLMALGLVIDTALK